MGGGEGMKGGGSEGRSCREDVNGGNSDGGWEDNGRGAKVRNGIPGLEVLVSFAGRPRVRCCRGFASK